MLTPSTLEHLFMFFASRLFTYGAFLTCATLLLCSRIFGFPGPDAVPALVFATIATGIIAAITR